MDIAAEFCQTFISHPRITLSRVFEFCINSGMILERCFVPRCRLLLFQPDSNIFTSAFFLRQLKKFSTVRRLNYYFVQFSLILSALIVKQSCKSTLESTTQLLRQVLICNNCRPSL